MEQALKLTPYATGAAADDIVDCHKLAEGVFGKDKCDAKDSGLTAFAYLWRRFGPPFSGTDPHKKLVGYVLTTSNPEVWLGVDLSASGLAYSINYWTSKRLQDKHRSRSFKSYKAWESKFEKWWIKQHPEFSGQLKKWKKLSDEEKKPVVEAYNNDRYDSEVLKKARPVVGKFVGAHEPTPTSRAINAALRSAMKELLRPVFVRDVPINIHGRLKDSEVSTKEAEVSKYAGYGVPRKAMDAHVKQGEGE